MRCGTVFLRVFLLLFVSSPRFFSSAFTKLPPRRASTTWDVSGRRHRQARRCEFLILSSSLQEQGFSERGVEETDEREEETIPEPFQFDDAIDLSVVVSWVENVFSNAWGNLEDVRPLYYDLGMGTTQVALCVSERNENIYVTFEGTNVMEFPDVMANLDVAWDRFGPAENVTYDDAIPGRVQRGWNTKVFNPQLYLPLSETLLQTVNRYPDYRIIITGHSMGAALSVLYGIYVATSVLPDRRVHVMNLGCPRVGDETFRRAVHGLSNLRIWRLVFADDIVPRLPPLWTGYRHVGHMVHWIQRGNVKDEDDEDDGVIVKAYHQNSCLDNEQPNTECVYTSINPEDWNVLKGNADDHEHDNYRCIVDRAKHNPDKYWPRDFEMRCP